MGDRISVSFANGGDESVALFSHWDGEAMVTIAMDYLRSLNGYLKGKLEMDPLDRLEPNTVMVDFIRYLTKNFNGRVTHNYYLGKDSNDGDNSDNGHVLFLLERTQNGLEIETQRR